MTMTMEREALAGELPVLPAAEPTVEQLKEALAELNEENLSLHDHVAELERNIGLLCRTLANVTRPAGGPAPGTEA